MVIHGWEYIAFINIEIYIRKKKIGAKILGFE